MKKTTFTTSVVLLSLFATPFMLTAMPIGSSNNPMEYLVKGRDLSWLSIGLYGSETKRSIERDATGLTTTLESRHVNGYIGIDALSWLTVYAIGGQSESKYGSLSYADGEAEYGVGIRANLLNHFLREPMLMEEDIRLNLGAHYRQSSSDLGATSIDWNEISAALTLALVNHSDRNKAFAPESVSIYAGPMFSTLLSDDFEAEDHAGAVAGIEIFFTDSVTLDIEVQHVGETSVGGGINLHF